MNNWTKKQNSEIPHVIAGPMVRLVTNKEVNIWVAVKTNAKITLKIYKPYISSDNTTFDSMLASSTVTPKKAGENLYIACVTAKSTSDKLFYIDDDFGPYGTNGVPYGYNLEFEALGSFHDDGILKVGGNGINKIVFDESPYHYKIDPDSAAKKLPSFVVTPDLVNDLNLFHGSCRKPHGGGIDALTVLHDRIASSFDGIEDGVVIRPQLLCLTGDQIYADDVGTSLLHMIDSYHDSGSIIGWKEKLPHTGVTDELLRTTQRHKILENILEIPAVDEDHAHNHLFRMSEYILMYCMAWSPELWTDDFPSFSEIIYPLVQSDYEVSKFYNVNVVRGNIKSKEGEFIDRTHDDISDYYKENKELRIFRDGLPNVRKALANISTLMVFDDHDVTDDWFFNEAWCLNVLEGDNGEVINLNKRDLGRRLMQNGMSAIALCQFWGNSPYKFLSEYTSGGKILKAINEINTLGNNANSDSNINLWNTLDNALIPELDTTSNPHRLKSKDDYSTYDWSWYLEKGNYEIFGLDIRTNRVFNQGVDGYSGLISNQSLDHQVKDVGFNKDKELSILLIGAPVIGVPSIEQSIGVIKDWVGPVTNFIHLTDISKESVDLESWNLDPTVKHTLFSKMLKRQTVENPALGKEHRALFLSGDVHYAFTNKVDYRVNNSFNEGELSSNFGGKLGLKIAQCCSSAIKNFDNGFNPGVSTNFMQHQRSKMPNLYPYSFYLDSLIHVYDKRSYANKVMALFTGDDEKMYGWNSTSGLETSDFNSSKKAIFDSDGTPAWLGSPMFPKRQCIEVEGDPIVHLKEEKLKFWIKDDITPQNTGNSTNTIQDWYYDLNFSESDPVLSNLEDIPSIDNSMESFLKLTAEHRQKSKEEGVTNGSFIVGYPNIGNIEFNWVGGEHKITHNITWINDKGKTDFLEGNTVNYAITQHIVDLD